MVVIDVAADVVGCMSFVDSDVCVDTLRSTVEHLFRLDSSLSGRVGPCFAG